MTSPDLPPPAASPLLRRARFEASLRVLRAAGVLSRGAARIVELATSFASHALDREDRSALTIRLFGHGRSTARAALFAWEEAWLLRDLPPAPARVLLGGAGRGSEARWLIDRGYTVVAFDPAPESVAQHVAVVPEARCAVLDYESLARASQTRRDGASVSAEAASVLDAAPYDAALLGWGSLTHVLEERDQDALFEALASLVPRGPILASFFMSTPAARGRAAALGARLGRALGPGADTNAGASARIACLTHAGFVYAFDRARLGQLAQCAGRSLALHTDGGYPHATFRYASLS